MATANWYYHRPGCKTCAKMDALLSQHDVVSKETINATKTRLGKSDALKLVADVKRVVTARGKKVVEFDVANGVEDEELLLKQMIGPTGNLRAPTIQVGETLLVGFHEAEFSPLLA